MLQGAFWGMILGFIVGAIRMILDFTYQPPRCGDEDTRPSIIAKVHYMYFALILFWLTIITIVVISYFTEPMPEANVSRSRHLPGKRVDLFFMLKISLIEFHLVSLLFILWLNFVKQLEQR